MKYLRLVVTTSLFCSSSEIDDLILSKFVASAQTWLNCEFNVWIFTLSAATRSDSVLKSMGASPGCVLAGPGKGILSEANRRILFFKTPLDDFILFNLLLDLLDQHVLGGESLHRQIILLLLLQGHQQRTDILVFFNLVERSCPGRLNVCGARVCDPEDPPSAPNMA